MAEQWFRGFGVIFALCVGCSGESKRDPDEPSTPLVPGTCVNTDCSWPEVQAFHPGPEVPCAAITGAPIAVEWSTEARTVDCPSGKCFAAPLDVAVGSAGEVWTSAHLLPHGIADIENPVGFELQRNGTSGALELERTTHLEQPPQEPTLNAVGLFVTAEGELDWVGPSPSANGLSLLHYDRAGALSSSKWLVEHATTSRSHLGPDGITVAYRYAGAMDASQDPPEIIQQVGVARFDRQGHLLWNQAAFAKLNVPLTHISLIGLSDDGGVYAIVVREPSFEAEGGVLLVRLSTNGSLDWVRERAGSWYGSTDPTSDTFVVAGSTGDGGTHVDRVDADGNGLWRTTIPDWADGIAVSGQGRTFLRPIGSSTAFVLASDASTCEQHSFELDTYLPGPGGASYSNDPVFARLPGERFAFAYSGRSGVLKLP
jgi:hypothetical protein